MACNERSVTRWHPPMFSSLRWWQCRVNSTMPSSVTFAHLFRYTICKYGQPFARAITPDTKEKNPKWKPCWYYLMVRPSRQSHAVELTLFLTVCSSHHHRHPHHNHHHHFNAHFPWVINTNYGLDGCLPTAYGKQPTFRGIYKIYINLSLGNWFNYILFISTTWTDYHVCVESSELECG